MLPAARKVLFFATSDHVPCFPHLLTLGPQLTYHWHLHPWLNSDFCLWLLKSLELRGPGCPLDFQAEEEKDPSLGCIRLSCKARNRVAAL